MKTFKQVDFWIQAVLVIVLIILIAFSKSFFFVGYVLVAVWQIISMIWHQAKGCYTGRSMKRFYYHRIALFILFVLALVPLIRLLILSYSFLYGFPVMALIYLKICYNETYQYMIRPLDLV